MCILTPTDCFTTILHPSVKDLTIECDEMIRKGWIPAGGPMVLPSGKFMQCFYKEYDAFADQLKKKTKSTKK